MNVGLRKVGKALGGSVGEIDGQTVGILAADGCSVGGQEGWRSSVGCALRSHVGGLDT